jgi:CTP synthase
VKVVPIHSELLEGELSEIPKHLEGLDGILVAPGFGERGIAGKIRAIQHVREQKIPFFGICLGMQCAVVEFANNVLGLPQAASTEVNPTTPDPVIDMMADQKAVSEKGGTMRLGAYPCKLAPGSKAAEIYGAQTISERHRHRFEFNNLYRERCSNAGLLSSGLNPENDLVEIVELKNHPFFVGVQFHPELKSTVENPHPLFVAFVRAAISYRQQFETTLIR